MQKIPQWIILIISHHLSYQRGLGRGLLLVYQPPVDRLDLELWYDQTSHNLCDKTPKSPQTTYVFCLLQILELSLPKLLNRTLVEIVVRL